ncbi:hypothetical protein [Leucobacter luti]|nr:hypothetical protein [Leucobacter luti]
MLTHVISLLEPEQQDMEIRSSLFAGAGGMVFRQVPQVDEVAPNLAMLREQFGNPNFTVISSHGSEEGMLRDKHDNTSPAAEIIREIASPYIFISACLVGLVGASELARPHQQVIAMNAVVKVSSMARAAVAFHRVLADSPEGALLKYDDLPRYVQQFIPEEQFVFLDPTQELLPLSRAQSE